MLTNHDDKVVVDENVARNILHLEKITLGGEGEGVQPGHRAHLHCNHFLCPSLAQVHVLCKFISSFFRVQIVNLKLFHAKNRKGRKIHIYALKISASLVGTFFI